MITLIPFDKNDVIEQINYFFYESAFGKALIASSPIGICYLAFIDDKVEALKELEKKFPNSILNEKQKVIHAEALSVISNQTDSNITIQLQVKGSDFQLKVWDLLLNIPFGQTTTYNQLATKLKMQNGARAVGTAVGKNPVAYLIPCHRVIGSNGQLSGYRWGLKRKAMMLEHEADKSLRLF